MRIKEIYYSRKIRIANNLDNSNDRDNEDSSIVEFLDTLDNKKSISLLEVGSGECRFIKKILSKYPFIDITCIELNPQLASKAASLGCHVINKNILDIKLDNQFDIVHCSHVIEHFDYPAIADVLDFLASATKTNGTMIIRSPLMHPKFYIDLDHVRPYPPEAILNYFYNPQQQRVGKDKVIVQRIWLRTSPLLISNVSIRNVFFPINAYRRLANKVIDAFNRHRIRMWNKYRWPATPPDGYVMISTIKRVH